MIKRLLPILIQFWRPLLTGLILAILTFMLLFTHLGSRPTAFLSAPEVLTRNSSRDLHNILKSPVNAPLTVPEHLFTKIRPESKASSRAISAIYGVVTLVLLFGILRFWQDSFTAILGTALFGTSSWFLHTARLDTPNVLFFGAVALLAAGLWLKHTLRRNLIALVFAVTIGITLYVPGLLWFMLVGAIWARKTILHELKHTKILTRVLAIVILLLMVAPLGWAIMKQPSIAWSVAGLPSHFVGVSQIGHNLIRIPVRLFIRGPLDPVQWLGRLPILDIFADAMLVLGAYSFWQHRKLYRSKLLFGGLIVSTALITVGGPVTITLLMPFIYILIAAGILYMLEAWQKVFPHNPVARSFGVGILVIAVALSCNFQLRSYFVAWQNSPTTKAVFNQPVVKL